MGPEYDGCRYRPEGKGDQRDRYHHQHALQRHDAGSHAAVLVVDAGGLGDGCYGAAAINCCAVHVVAGPVSRRAFFRHAGGWLLPVLWAFFLAVSVPVRVYPSTARG